jgi:hypothetical protein
VADEAFALSPISARAAPPSEADYDAIREAFIETARGRWFLSEYAKRNRNADTRMVLDAVARIEETLAAQRQPPPPDNSLSEALAAIRGAVDRAEDKVAQAATSSALEESLAPIRKGARIIKEISWRWREIGADGRICDLIDSQVASIETGCGKIASIDPRVALREAFEEIRAEIEAFRDNGGHATAAPEPQATTVVVPFPPAADHAVFASATRRDEATRARVEAPISPPEPPIEAVAATAEAADAEADAHDEAVLELVAAEMAAPDPSQAEVFPVLEAEETHITPPPAPPEPITVARAPEPKIAPLAAEPTRRTVPVAIVEPLIRPTLAPAPEPSLGSMIIANNILPKKEPASDPLAPIRRMTQAEKIAFFS